MNSYLKTPMALIAALLIAPVAEGALKTQVVEYKDGDVTCEGYLAYDDAIAGPRPGVLVVHEWMGQGPYAKMRADMLAQAGYVAFAADIYGKGIRPRNTDEAATQASTYRKDRQLMRRRAQVALQVLADNRSVDRKKIAAIGYCFGGGTVLELARSGANLAGVVSFHGNLDTPNPADAENVKGKVLVLHGGADPYVPAEQLAAFEKEMTDAGVDWQMVVYGGAVHSFTNLDSGTDASKGAAYNEKADKRSWLVMKQFFDEIFK